MDPSVCCFNQKSFPTNSTITTTNSADGCVSASLQCRDDGGKAMVAHSVENHCSLSTSKQMQELKTLLEQYIYQTEQSSCSEEFSLATNTTATTTESVEEVICKAPWIQLSTGCYLFSEEPMNWTGAKQFCLKKDAILVEIESAEEDAAIIDAIYSQQYDTLKRQPWLGLTDSESEGTFKFASSGNTAVYTNWAPNEPNDKYGTENCVHIGMEWWAKDQWNDNNCNFTEEHGYTFHALCEKLG